MKNLLPFLLCVLFCTVPVHSRDLFMKDYRPFKGHRTTVFALAFSKDGRYLVASGGKNQVIAWDVSSGRQVMEGIRNPQNKPLNYLALNDAGTLIATTGFMDPAVTISRFRDGRRLHRIRAHRGEKSGLAFMPGKDILVTAGTDEKKHADLKVWDARQGRLIKVLYQSSRPVNQEYLSGLAFSPDGRRLVCGISNVRHGIIIFNMISMRKIKYIPYGSDVSTVAFSPDGEYIAGGCTDKNVVLWNAASGKIVRVMRGHNGYVSTVAFSPDGKYIASAGRGYHNIFRLWDVRTGVQVQAMDERNQGVDTLAFSPDGKHLAVGLTTHGDLFAIDTVRLFSTASAERNTPWFKVSSSGANLKISFPRRPEMEERYRSDRYYAYSRFTLDKGTTRYFVRVIEYRYNVSQQKGNAQVKKNGLRLVERARRRGARLGRSGTFEYRGNRGIEYILVRRKRRSDYRMHYRLIFIDNFLYELRYTGYGKEASPGEKRFFNSFGTWR